MGHPGEAIVRRYLGDGVYVDYDGYHVVLMTKDGVQVTNRILLDPDAWTSLDKWADDLKKKLVKGEK